MTDSCARCGKTQEEMPESVIYPNGEDGEPEIAHRFALYDDQRMIFICPDCVDVYHELLPLATQYPMLRDMPELLDEVRTQVPNDELKFFQELLPGGKF